MGQIPRGLLLAVAVAAAAGLVLAAERRQYVAIGVLAAIAGFLVVATRMHSGAAEAVRKLMGRPLRLDIWGTPVSGDADQTFRLERVQAFGAGLLIWARSDVTKTVVFIKVAQPRDLLQQDGGLTIGRAKYVQVDKSTVPVVAGTPALLLVHSPLRG